MCVCVCVCVCVCARVMMAWNQWLFEIKKSVHQ